MKKKILFLGLGLLLLIGIVIAWTPPSSIDLQNFFNITKAKDVQVLNNLTVGNTSAGLTCIVYGDGSNMRFNCTTYGFVITNLTGLNNTPICATAGGQLFRC